MPTAIKAKDALDHPVTVRSILWTAGTSLGIVSVLATIHARVVVPAILQETSKQIEERISRHEMGTHSSSLPRAEFSALLSEQRRATDSMLEQISLRLQRIENRLDALADGKKQ